MMSALKRLPSASQTFPQEHRCKRVKLFGVTLGPAKLAAYGQQA